MKKFLLVVFAWFSFMGLAFAGAPVDLNAANQAQLESVKGIGPVKAKAIIEYRTKNGPFKSVDDLQKVTGFGKASVGKLRAEVSVGGAKTAEVKASDAKKAGTKAADVKADTKKAGK
ncbi:MAG: ComEA family DNA-binding protein [Sulfuricella sp.]